MPTTFVLVHGAFGSPAELAPVVPYLEELGHRVVNVDLPCERAGSTLEDYADAVVRAMDGIPHPRVLVAHSAGGATIPLVAAQVPAERLVYVAAVVPEPGQSISVALGPEAVEAIGAVTIDNGDGTRSFNIDLLASFAPPEEREAYVAFQNGTQRRQGWPAVNQPWPGGGARSRTSRAPMSSAPRTRSSPRTAAGLRGPPGGEPDRDRLGPRGLRLQAEGTRRRPRHPRRLTGPPDRAA